MDMMKERSSCSDVPRRHACLNQIRRARYSGPLAWRVE
jgi:hypothetical protein